jgi:hypothetical protein
MNYPRCALLASLFFAFALPARAAWVSPFISEIHYDNAGADVNELVAVTGPAGLDLSGWSIVLYNGSNGQPYRSVALSGQLGAAGGSWAEDYWSVGSIQNGPDAVALVSAADNLVDFVAYEAAVSATAGAASGRVANLLPVSEDASSAPTSSLQRTGGADDWVWMSAPATPGLLNPGLAGLDAVAVPAMNAWQLWPAGLCAWLLLSVRRRPWSAVEAQPLRVRCE